MSDEKQRTSETLTRRVLLAKLREAALADPPDPRAVAEMWRREVDGMGRRYIEQMAIHGEELMYIVSEDALRAGVTPEVVRQTLEECRKRYGYGC